MEHLQESFDPTQYNFEWTFTGCSIFDWYTWDRVAGVKAAKAARAERVKALRGQGYQVKCWTLRHQVISHGGIGTGRPHIELLTTVYMLDATKEG